MTTCGSAQLAKRVDNQGVYDYIPIYPVSLEGRLAIVTNAGRDAVDAAASGRNEGCRVQSRSKDAFSCGGHSNFGMLRERPEVRLTTTLRDADRGGDAPHLHRLCAAAQVVWSLSKSGLLFSRANRLARSTAETTASGFGRCRGEHEASRKTTVCGTPDVSGAFVVANSCACFYRA